MTAIAVERPAAASWVRALTLLLALLLFALVLRPTAHVFDMPMTEDGYYALSVARNLAAGHGLTIDGVHLTNGFQPLFTLLEAGAFRLAGSNDALALRLVMALGWIFYVAGASVVAALARESWPAASNGEREQRGWIAAFLYLAAPLLFNHAYNGLETGCTLFFYALAARWMQAGRDRSWAGLAGFGAILGLLVLARIDAAFVAAALGVNELRRARHGGLGHMLARGAVLGGTALLISSPWWLYNTLDFGTPMPTSGVAQQAFGLDGTRLANAEWALRVVLVPWIFAGAHEGDLAFGSGSVTLTGALRSLALIGGAVLLWRAARHGVFGRDLARASEMERAMARRTLEFAACFGAGFAAVLAYYVFVFSAYWFYYRYFAPVALVAFVLAPVLAARGLRNPRVRPCLATAAVLLSVQMALIVGLAMSGRGLGGNTVFFDQVALVRDNVPAEDAVAAGQAGTLGFFRDHVINTDGKVNRDAIAYQDHMWDYLRAHHVKWFADWASYANKYLGVPLDATGERPAPEAHGWRLKAERNSFFLYEYVGPATR